VYIADFLDNLVEKVTTGGQLSVLAGGGSTVPTPGNSPMAATSALLSQPKAVAVDSSGNVYFADTAHNEIDKVTTGGQLSVIAGGGSTVPTLSNSPVTATTALLSSPTGVAISSSGNLYISDDSHNLIEEVTNPGVSGALSVVAGGGSTVPSTTPALATSVLVSQPYGVAVDSSGNVFFSSFAGDDLDELAVSTGDVAVIAGGGSTVATTVNSPITGTAAYVQNPRGVAVDSIGNVYVADEGHNDIEEVNPAAATPVAPTFSAQSPATSATVGTSYGYPFVAGGTPTPTYALVGQPSWLTIGANTGIVVGTPPVGNTTFTYGVIASNGTNPTATAGPFTVATSAAPTAPTFSAQSPATTATVGTSYSYPFVAAGPPTPAYALVGQPSWLSIGASTGIVVGTPPVGNTTFTYGVIASNGINPTATAGPFTVATSPASLAPATPSVTVTTVPVAVPPVTVTAVPPTSVLPPSSPLLVPSGGGAAATPTGAGYWALSPSGDLSNYGNAGNFGSENSLKLNAPIVAVNSTTSGDGYWLVGADGGVFTFGNATFEGSMAGKHLDSPIVAMSRTTNNGGYLLAAANGGVFSFGDATFEGSMSGKHLNGDITSMVSSPGANGYWLVGSDGGVFSFGGAHFYGSLGAIDVDRHIVGIAATPTGKGYWLVGTNGVVSAFGDAKFFGSMPASATTRIVGIVADGNVGYRLITAQGKAVPFGTTPS
jgi:hypothetical protein